VVRVRRARPRLQRAMPAAGHLEVLRGHDPTTGIHDRRCERLLVRIDPHYVAGVISTLDGPGPRFWFSSPRPLLTGYVVSGPADNIPVGVPPRGQTVLIKSRRSSKARTEADTSSERHPRRGSQIASESDLGSAFDPTRTVARAGTEDSTPGSHWSPTRRTASDRYGDKSNRRRQPCRTRASAWTEPGGDATA
jgi:hypothetical protein